MRVYIKENSRIAKLAAWKLGQSAMAITLGRTIYLHNTLKTDFLSDKNWVCHELTHVYQFKQHGCFVFLIIYAWESLLKGYHNNKWEVEARASEHNHSLLDNIEFR